MSFSNICPLIYYVIVIKRPRINHCSSENDGMLGLVVAFLPTCIPTRISGSATSIEIEILTKSGKCCKRTTAHWIDFYDKTNICHVQCESLFLNL